MESIRVLLAHKDEQTRQELEEAIRELGYEIAGVFSDGDKLEERAKSDPPDLIITSACLDSKSGIDVLVDISEDEMVPAIVVTVQRSLELVEEGLRDHVMAYLIEPVNADEIKPTIYLVLRRFEQFQELRQEVADLKQALADRKVIERAKGVLMRRGDIDEEEAYKRLRRMATDNRIKLVEASDRVLSVEEILTEPS